MERTHEVSLYRRGGSTGRTAAGRPKQSWAQLAASVPVNFQPVTGRLVPGGDGQQVKIDAMLFAHPDDYPTGVTPQAGDGVVVTSGPASRSTYLVHAFEPQGGGPWDDEFQLVAIEESVP
ncbi:MAG TPA: hypothetical protein VLH81_01555 [Desulfobacterales bacterium]|nr:hypothetical protein [Desulfobacterales bacterium]